jgi:Predicted membrane protein
LPKSRRLADRGRPADAAGGARLLIFTLIATYFFHDFWNQPPGPEQMNNMIHAMKNLSICGAFLMLAGSGAGRFSMDGRTR